MITPNVHPYAPGSYSELADGIWNQWIEPLAVHYGNRTWIGRINSDGGVGITVVDHTTGAASSQTFATITDDDHNAAAVCHGGANYKTMVFYSNHASDKLLRYVVSSSPDSTTFGSPQSVTMPENITYCQAFRVGARVFVFCRQRPHWAVRWTDDDGATWETTQNVFGSHTWLYMIARQDGNTLHVAAHQHPSNGDTQDLYFYNINLVSGDITKPGSETALGNLFDSETLPVTWTDGLQVYDAAAGEATRLFNVGLNNDVVFAKWTNLNNATYHHISITAEGVATVTELTTAGDALMDSVIGYFGGVNLSDGGNVYLSCNHNGVWSIEEWENDSGWFRKRLHVRSATKQFRPIGVKNPHADLPVVWCAGTYTTYEAGFDTGVCPNVFTPTSPTIPTASPTFTAATPVFV